MTAVAGLRSTADWGPDERPKNFRDLILWRSPNGSAPLFALMAKVASESVNDPEFSWWDESQDLIRLQLDGSIATSAVTTFNVDSSDPDASNPGRVYGLATHLKPGDLLMVETADNQVMDNEIVMVSSVISPTSIGVAREQAGTTAAAPIPDDTYLLKIGSAYAEGTGAPEATSRNPVKYTNLCQIFKTAYEITGTTDETKARTGNARTNDKKRKVFDHSKDIEFAMMFGQKFETTGSNGKPLRFMGGLREFIPTDTTTIFGASVTDTQFLDATYPLFDWDTGAGDERIALCGNGYLNTLNKLAKSNGEVHFVDTIKVYGMNMRRYVLPQGTIFLRSHPLLNRHPVFTYSSFLLDFSSIRYRYLRNTTPKDNIQANDEDTKKGQWLTEAGIEVAHGGLTCGYHGNFASVA